MNFEKYFDIFPKLIRKIFLLGTPFLIILAWVIVLESREETNCAKYRNWSSLAQDPASDVSWIVVIPYVFVLLV